MKPEHARTDLDREQASDLHPTLTANLILRSRGSAPALVQRHTSFKGLTRYPEPKPLPEHLRLTSELSRPVLPTCDDCLNKSDASRFPLSLTSHTASTRQLHMAGGHPDCTQNTHICKGRRLSAPV